MRQVVLVVVLVGAAFLGGAFVNGPGLRWAQAQLLGSLGLGEEGEIASVDLKMGASPDGSGEHPGRVKSAGEAARGPVAPVPAPVGDAKPGAADRPPIRRDGIESKGDPRRPASAPSVPPRRSLPSPATTTTASPRRGDEDGPREGDDPPPLPVDLPAHGSSRAPRDPDLTLAAASALPPPRPPRPGDPAASDREARPALADSLAALMPSPAPAPPDAPRPRAPAPAKPGDDDWADLARKMQALGVSRFTIEGQPGGRAVFSCLIPVAGRQAVAQRFEAEGEDAVQAARAALRRVALWRAAQPR